VYRCTRSALDTAPPPSVKVEASASVREAQPALAKPGSCSSVGLVQVRLEGSALPRAGVMTLVRGPQAASLVDHMHPSPGMNHAPDTSTCCPPVLERSRGAVA
jgi:hypothetical protein